MTIRHMVRIEGQPIGKGRPRFTRNGGTYTPEKTATWERIAAAQLRQAIGWKMYDMPMKLHVTAYFNRPKRLLTRKSSENRIHHTAKPDADNILKIVCDALVMAGVVRDDSIINHMAITKYYAAKGAPVEVCILLDSWENEHHPTDRIRRQTALVPK